MNYKLLTLIAISSTSLFGLPDNSPFTLQDNATKSYLVFSFGEEKAVWSAHGRGAFQFSKPYLLLYNFPGPYALHIDDSGHLEFRIDAFVGTNPAKTLTFTFEFVPIAGTNLFALKAGNGKYIDSSLKANAADLKQAVKWQVIPY